MHIFKQKNSNSKCRLICVCGKTKRKCQSFQIWKCHFLFVFVLLYLYLYLREDSVELSKFPNMKVPFPFCICIFVFVFIFEAKQSENVIVSKYESVNLFLLHRPALVTPANMDKNGRKKNYSEWQWGNRGRAKKRQDLASFFKRFLVLATLHFCRKETALWRQKVREKNNRQIGRTNLGRYKM